jgi:FMNH2-dependent dimethyl sulfone monooxygenase
MAGAKSLDEVVAETKAGARELGREVKVFGQASVFCAASEAEARAYFDHCVNDQGDFAAADNLMRLFGLTRDAAGDERASMPQAVRDKIRHSMVAAHGGAVLIGTPTQVVEQMQALADAGLDGTTLSWIDFEAGLVQFKAEILPLMIQAGLRVDEPELQGTGE